MFLNSRSGKNAREFVERKLLLRLKLFFAVFAILLSVIVYEISRHHIKGPTVIGAMMLGMMIGAAFVRRKRIYWEEETSRVIARMDRVGVALLVIYVTFAIIRHFLLEHWVHGSMVLGFSFSLAAGTPCWGVCSACVRRSGRS